MSATTKQVSKERTKIVAMYKSGKSQSEIGHILGIPRQSVAYHLAAGGRIWLSTSAATLRRSKSKMALKQGAALNAKNRRSSPNIRIRGARFAAAATTRLKSERRQSEVHNLFDSGTPSGGLRSIARSEASVSRAGKRVLDRGTND